MTTSAAATADPANPSGLLVLDKPLHMTSMDVCYHVRTRIAAGGGPRRAKVGHGGTLDPLATGVLVVMVGRATKLCERVMADEKEYDAQIDLSRVSTTDDLEGTATPVDVPDPPTRESVNAACAGFVGAIRQRPPAHSAVWVGGERSYKRARAGEKFVMAERFVDIHGIEVRAYSWPALWITVRCGKGTYIRSLARDLGPALGTGGMLVGLRRTRVGAFGADRAVQVRTLPERLAAADLLPPAAFGLDLDAR